MRWVLSVVTPLRAPESTSACLTHSSKVCGAQPIFGAIDATAAHSEGYSPRCYWTIRTARSWNPDEELGVFFMAPSSQELEPPRNPGRFSEPDARVTLTPVFIAERPH
jgi:hypothetical protein